MVAEALEATTIQIINALGSVVLNETVNSNNITLKTNNLTSGVYFIKVENKNGGNFALLIFLRIAQDVVVTWP